MIEQVYGSVLTDAWGKKVIIDNFYQRSICTGHSIMIWI